MEQNQLDLGTPQDGPHPEIIQAAPMEFHPSQGVEIKLEQQPVQFEQVFEESKDPKIEPDEGEVQVIYLNVPETEEPQVLDLSSLLAQQGIQVVDQTEIQAIDGKDGANVFRAEDIIIEEANGNGNITMVAASQSEAQSAHALLNLANAQADGSPVQVSDILAAQRQAQEEEENATAGKALLQLASDQNAGTYIVDENGTMIPLSDMRGENMLPVEDTGVTTIAICQCFCGREFISQEDLERHKAAHKYQRQSVTTSGEEVVTSSQSCTLCTAKFPSTRELIQHHKEAHPGEMPWECEVCNKRYHKKVAMKAHMRVHNAMARYQCSTCKKVFYYKRAMTRHIKQHTCEKPFKCTICGEMLNTLWELRKHRINHQVRSLYHCDICSKVFKQKATLVVHSRVHTGQRPYACDICSKSFSLKSTLTQHRRIHTGEKPNVCPICGQRFRQGSTMQAHMKRHTHDKPYICRYCRMRFAYQDELTEHELAHAQNKKWQCDECGMRFKNQSLLARHCRRHTNERPFVCEVCNKSFVQSGSLRAHMRSHTNEKPYYCRMCSKAYATSGTLLLHIRKVHNLAAKTVKEVFPVHKYIEDQKVFTIRNKPLVGNEMVVHSDAMTAGGERVTVLVDETSDANTTTTQQFSNEKENLSNGLENTIQGEEKTQNVVVVTSEGEFSVTASTHVDDVVVNAIESGAETPAAQQTVPKPTSEAEIVTKVDHLEDVLNSQEDGIAPVQVAAEVDISSHSLHSAQDRQEAALGLAELSLFGAGAAGGSSNSTDPADGATSAHQQSNQKTKTFFKEEEEDENDPNVTKIILSKEGGVMNSQDPHQCPVCHRIFGRKSIMVEHLRIHTDEKPYECDFCGAGFRQNAQLRSHIRNRHTRVERYQCSFCHNRFLSRSITIRHIKFHHKLKMKFCKEANPEWTVESAVWCDDKFEFNIEDPQYLKVSKKNKATGKRPKKGVLQAENSEDTFAQTLTDMVPSGQSFVVKVSDQGPVSSSEVTIESTPGSSQTVAVDGEEGEASQNLGSTSARTVGTLTYATPESKQEDHEAVSVSQVTDSDYLGSQLLCGTCKMQFDSVASLREHLRNIHNTTLAESDVSYVYEDNVNGEQTQGTLDSERKGQTQQVMSGSQTEVTLQDLKPVVLSVDAVSQRKGRRESVNDMDVECLNVCRMCSQGFYYRDDLDQHMKSHTEEEVESVGMHRCDTCSLVLKNTQEVAKHIQRCHGVSKIFSCSICDKEFFQESSVYRHMKFFHKWEIKIRGEINIPVIVKPAPKVLHSPSATSGYSMPKTRTDRRKMSKLGKFPSQGTVIGVEVDKIIQGVVGSQGAASEAAADSSTVSIELAGQEANLLDKSTSDFLAPSSAGKDSLPPSFIIVRDGALTEEGDTQKIVEKLMTLFRSKTDSADGDAKKQPKIVKVTTVGFSEDEMNAITETDLTEALAQLDENSEAHPNRNYATTSASSDIPIQNPSSSDENLSGKGYFSTLQGKKRAVGLETTVCNEENVKREDSVGVSSVSTDGSLQNTQSQFTENLDRDSSLFQILKKERHTQSLTKDSGSPVIENQNLSLSTDHLLDNSGNHESLKSVQSTRKKRRVSDTSKAVETVQDTNFKKILGGQENLGSPDCDLEKVKSENSAVLKTEQQRVTADKSSGLSVKKSTISTLAAPSQTQGSSLTAAKLSNNRTIESSNEAESDSMSNGTLNKTSVDTVARDKTDQSVPESTLTEVKTSTITQKKSIKAKATSKKPIVKVEPPAERRSSSGRLIKRKTFGDEIEDMSPLVKRKK